MYLGQAVELSAHTDYRISLDVRGKSDLVNLSIPLCEKSLLYSFRCNLLNFTSNSKGNWVHLEQKFNTAEVGEPVSTIFNKEIVRPLQLALHNETTGKIVEVDNISLTDALGRNLLRNGDFSSGSDFWFFNTDNHQAANIDNLWVHVLFDQGWAGLVLFSLLFTKALYNTYKHLRGNLVSPAPVWRH